MWSMNNTMFSTRDCGRFVLRIFLDQAAHIHILRWAQATFAKPHEAKPFGPPQIFGCAQMEVTGTDATIDPCGNSTSSEPNNSKSGWVGGGSCCHPES